MNQDDAGVRRAIQGVFADVAPALPSRQNRIMEAAVALGRHLHCPYCDARTVAPDVDTYRFICTRCQASWDCSGQETMAPCRRASEVRAAEPGRADRFIDLEED